LIVSIPKPFLDDTFELQSEIIQVVHNLNNYLESIRGRDLQILDISKFINLIGSQVAYKETYVQMDTSPYTLEFVRYFSQLSACVLIKQLLPYKKILILDCDETLWGGITAEVGPLDITLDTISQSGIFFHKLQKIFSEFREKGVILGMCSKNNFESIKSTFTINDYMVLSLEDFVAIKVNWKPKSINILDICSELNILSDSVVFIDDSLFELNEVISGQHKITCIQTPTTDFEIELLKWKLQILFSNISITSEDQKRTQYYQHKTLRDNQVNNYTTYDDYLKSLNTCVKLTKCSDQTNIERIVQLSQKTNQFNFMYSRFDRNDIIRILRQNDYTIYTGEVKDNVGDSGIVFLLVTREINLNPKKIEIIELTLSCRVFGRNVAEKSVIFIMEHLKNIGVEKILCGFNESNKNLQFKDFLPNLKFKLVTSSAHNFGFEFDLKNTQITQLDYPNVKADF
jgi:FkbH-like protein